MDTARSETLASAGAELIANGYHILPIKPGTKRPGVNGWSQIEADVALLEKWLAEGRGGWGVGIRGTTPAVDLDISDEAVLAEMEAWCREHIGVANTRIGRAPRKLFVYRTEEAFAKFESDEFFSPDGVKHQVEVIGDTAQFVAYAVHPDTKRPYVWDGSDPLTTPKHLLPTLSLEQAKALVAHFESIIPADWKRGSTSSSKTDRSEHEGNPRKTADLAQIRSAMEAIPNDDLQHKEWARVMYALFAAVGDHKAEGCEIWHDWSQKSSKYQPEETQRVWDADKKVKHVGAGTLFFMAKEHGWVRPSIDTSCDFQVFEDDDIVVTEAIPDEPASKDGAMPVVASSQKIKVGNFEFSFETAADLRRLPPLKWLIKDWIPEGGIGILVGKWGSFKTFIAFDIALHLAYGLSEWHGAVTSGEERSVLYLSHEGHVGFIQRIDAFKHRHGLDHDQELLTIMRAPINFMNDAQFAAFEQALKSLQARKSFSLIVVDTVARTMAGADMSGTDTVPKFMERCARLAHTAGCALMAIHHSNKGDEMMGSEFFAANSDFIFKAKRIEETMNLEIKCVKMKDGEDGWAANAQLQKEEWGGADGLISSLVVHRIGTPYRKKEAGVQRIDLGVSKPAVALLNSLAMAQEKNGGRAVTWAAWVLERCLEENENWKPGEKTPLGCSHANLMKLRKELIDAGHVNDPDGSGERFGQIELEMAA